MNINDSVQKSGPLSTNMCSVCVLPVHKGEGDNCPTDKAQKKSISDKA